MSKNGIQISLDCPFKAGAASIYFGKAKVKGTNVDTV
jgi:hypothetical protein